MPKRTTWSNCSNSRPETAARRGLWDRRIPAAGSCQHSVCGLGVDHDPSCIATAQQSAAAIELTERCEFRMADVNDLATEPGKFDLGICLGSTHAFGVGEAAYPNTIARLSDAVRPGGLILIGEGYWKQPPAQEYLELIGDPVGIYRDHAANIAFAEERGLLAQTCQ